jgi:hypothetical protein
MILYNTLMGVLAGIVILTMSSVILKYKTQRLIGHGIALLVAGIPLTVLSFMMAVTWPLHVNPPINIAFAEPSLLLGVLAVIAGYFLSRGLNMTPAGYTVLIDWKPVRGLIAVLGVMLFAISMAIFRFNLVGDAPDIEPITGQFKGWENTTFGLVYLAAAIGTMAVWFSDKPWGAMLASVMWKISGGFFLLFSLLNYYTHIGMLVCANGGECNSF